ncbi:MAG TPA: sugar-binding domain-containing protein, partial [Pseudobacillus sp.]
MQTIIDIQKKIVPDLLDILQKRYEILQSIRLSQPVGRRVLAQSLGFTERTLRTEVDFLKTQRLIDYRTTGMILTEEGVSVLEELQELMSSIKGIHTMEEKLKKRFGLDEVVIIHGDSEQSSWVKKELGKACANSIKKRLLAKNIIAVTGGTTTLEVAEAMTADFAGGKEIVFVPARGGLGEDLLNQANSIVGKMAANTGSRHKLLYAPDQISRETHESILKE